MLVNVKPGLSLVQGDWKSFLSIKDSSKQMENLPISGRTGRPLGNDKFIEFLEKNLAGF